MGMRLSLFMMVLFLVSFAYALDVNLVSPSDGASFTDSNEITFECSANIHSGDVLGNVSLYHNISASSDDIVFIEGMSQSDVSFDIENVPNGMYKWNCYALNESNDVGVFGDANFTFSVDVNVPVFSGSIDDFNWSEDSSLNDAIDLSSYFSGASSYTASGNDSVVVDISNGVVDLSAEDDFCGIEDIIFKGCSGGLCNDSNSVEMNVSCVNDAPISSLIPNVTVTYGSSKSVDLDDYFSDVEGDSLSYNASSVNNLTVVINGSDADIEADVGFVGSRVVFFSAYDGEFYTTESLGVSVVADGNTAPIIGSHSPTQGNITMDEGGSLSFSITKSDPQGQFLTVRWYKDDQAIFGGSLDTYTFNASYEDAGSHTIKVEVSDGELITRQVWNVLVNDVAVPGQTVSAPSATVAECGDGNIDIGENCANCEADVKCAEDEKCETGVCVTKRDYKKFMIILMSVVVLCLIGFLFYKFGSKLKKLFKRKDAKKVEKEAESETKKEEFFEGLKEESVKQARDPVGDYIKNSLGMGKTGVQVRSELKAKGWNDNQINDVFGRYNVKG